MISKCFTCRKKNVYDLTIREFLCSDPDCRDFNGYEPKQRVTPPKTNLQKLATMTPEEAYRVIYWLITVYGKGFTQSELAIIEWLKKEAET